MRFKTIAITILLILFAVGAGFAVYRFLIIGGEPQINGGENNNGNNETSNILREYARSHTPAIDYWINRDTVYLLTHRETLMKGGRETDIEITPQKILGAAQISGSPSGEFVLVQQGMPATPSFSVFTLETAEWRPLPTTTLAATWHPSLDRIAFLDRTSGGRLATFDPETGAVTELIRVGIEAARLSWVTESDLFITDYPSAFALGFLWKFNTRTRILEPIIQDEFGLSLAIGDTHFLKLVRNARESTLVLTNQENRALRTLPFATIPEKCTFDLLILFCAVPRNIPKGTTLPDDYLMGRVQFSDDLITWDIETGTLTTILSGEQALIDAEQLTVNETTLFFLNRMDGRVYAIPRGGISQSPN